MAGAGVIAERGVSPLLAQGDVAAAEKNVVKCRGFGYEGDQAPRSELRLTDGTGSGVSGVLS